MPIRDIIIFVYGTLMQGYWNHRLLENADFLGKGYTVSNNFIMRAHAYPFVTRATAEQQAICTNIQGEVYAVTEQELKELDRLEGHPSFYDREQVQIQYQHGSTVTAWIYTNGNTQANFVLSGNFRDYDTGR